MQSNAHHTSEISSFFLRENMSVHYKVSKVRGKDFFTNRGEHLADFKYIWLTICLKTKILCKLHNSQTLTVGCIRTMHSQGG